MGEIRDLPFSYCSGSITAILAWLHYADPGLAPYRRSATPVGSNRGNLFFPLVNACYERCAMILTSNRGFGEWGEVFGDTVVAAALLDRLLHHAIVVPIEGSSFRLS